MEASKRATATLIAESLGLESVVGWAPSLPSLGVGFVEAFEPPPDATKPLLSWLSLLSISTAGIAAASAGIPEPTQDQVQLTAWSGPLTDVPHLITRLSVVHAADESNESLRLMMDFRPRLDAGYQDDPEPTSRAAFVKAGVRRDYDTAFFTPETRQWRETMLASCHDHGAVENAVPSAKVFSRVGSGKGDWSVCHGPLYLDVTMPHTETSLRTCLTACQDATDRWQTWVKAANTDTDDASSWMNSRLIYDRDNQVRAELFSNAVGEYEELLYGDADADADKGRVIALADAGRLDMIGHNDIGRGEGDYY